MMLFKSQNWTKIQKTATQIYIIVLNAPRFVDNFSRDKAFLWSFQEENINGFYAQEGLNIEQKLLILTSLIYLFLSDFVINKYLLLTTAQPKSLNQSLNGVRKSVTFMMPKFLILLNFTYLKLFSQGSKIAV